MFSGLFNKILSLGTRRNLIVDCAPGKIVVHNTNHFTGSYPLIPDERDGLSSGRSFTETLKLAIEESKLPFSFKRPAYLVSQDPSWGLTELEPVRKALRTGLPESILFIDRFLASCSGIPAIAESRLRTPVVFLMGNRTFQGVYFNGSLYQKEEIPSDLSLRPAELLNRVIGIATDRSPFPQSQYENLPEETVNRLRSLWEKGCDPGLHIIVEQDSFNKEHIELKELTRLHISESPMSFAVMGMLNYYRDYLITQAS